MTEFVPLCMTPEELAAWREANERTVRYGLSSPTNRPCVDCPLAFAQAMRAVGQCNGTPQLACRPRKAPEPGSERRRAQWREAKKRQRWAAYMREYRAKHRSAA